MAQNTPPAASRSARSRASRPTARGSTRPGPPSVQVAILDTGIRWDKGSLRKKVALNRGELPLPAQRRVHLRAVRLQLGRRVQRRRLRERPARGARPTATTTSPAPTRFLDASDLIAAFSDAPTTTATASSTTSPAGTSSTTTTTPTTRPATRAPATTAPAAPRRPASRPTRPTAARASAPSARSCRCACGTRSWWTPTTSRRPCCTRPTTTSRSSRARPARCSTPGSPARRSSTPTSRACSSRSCRRT